MKFVAIVAVLSAGLAMNAHAAEEISGFYIKGSLGQARTTLDTANTVHATDTSARMITVGLQYRF